MKIWRFTKKAFWPRSKKMRIGIDASRYGEKIKTGVERYSNLLIPPLVKVLKETGHEVILYSNKQLPEFSGVRNKIFRMKKFWSQLYLGLAAQLDRVDILFVPSHVLPLMRPKNCVVFIHDCCFEEFPDAYSFFDRWYLRLTTAEACRNAKVLTHSNQTAQNLKNIFGAQDTYVVRPARMDVSSREVTVSFKKPYILYVGRIESKKNIENLIVAFDHLLKKNVDIAHNLILMGSSGYGAEDIFRTHAQLRFKDRIIFSGYSPDKLRDQAMRDASGIVLPSICEGTSLVLLEARTARLPFAASSCQPCREAGGQTGIYVKNNSAEEWTVALNNLIENPRTPDPAPTRTWEMAAREIAGIITDGLDN